MVNCEKIYKNASKSLNLQCFVVKVFGLLILKKEFILNNNNGKLGVKVSFMGLETSKTHSIKVKIRSGKPFLESFSDFYFSIPLNFLTKLESKSKEKIFIKFNFYLCKEKENQKNKNLTEKFLFGSKIDSVRYINSNSVCKWILLKNHRFKSAPGYLYFGVFPEIPKLNIEVFNNIPEIIKLIKSSNKKMLNAKNRNKNKKENPSEMIMNLIASFFNNSGHNHEEILENTFTFLTLLEERNYRIMFLLITQSIILTKNKVNVKYENILRDIFKHLLKESVEHNDYFCVKYISDVAQCIFFKKSSLNALIKNTPVYKSFDYYRHIFSISCPNRNQKKLFETKIKMVIKTFVSTMFLNGLNIETILKFITKLTVDLTHNQSSIQSFIKNTLNELIIELKINEKMCPKINSELSFDGKEKGNTNDIKDINRDEEIEWDLCSDFGINYLWNERLRKIYFPLKEIRPGRGTESQFFKYKNGEFTVLVLQNVLNSEIRIEGNLNLTNFRLLFTPKQTEKTKKISKKKLKLFCRMPIFAISNFDCKKESNDLHTLKIALKDCRSLSFTIETEEATMNAFKDSLERQCFPPSELNTFAFSFKQSFFGENGWKVYSEREEFQRQRLSEHWALVDANKNFSLCETYPETLVVPEDFKNNLKKLAKKRMINRLPVLTYFCREKQSALIRSSQPRLTESQKELEKIYDLKYIVDARPKINAMVNTAAGGGRENKGDFDILFCGIPNIHSVRESFKKLLKSFSNKGRSSQGLLSNVPDGLNNPNVLMDIQCSGWLDTLKTLLYSSKYVVETIYHKRSNVLVHCSDGWDRTSQLVALAQLMLDPFYRTMRGFVVLIEKDFLSFGHMFSTRTGHTVKDNLKEASKMSPIFLQFLDCVYQLLRKYGTYFEFNEDFLVFIFEESVNCRYGTFLFDNEMQRAKYEVRTKTFSVWTEALRRREKFINPLFAPFSSVILPDFCILDLCVWPYYYRVKSPKIKTNPLKNGAITLGRMRESYEKEIARLKEKIDDKKSVIREYKIFLKKRTEEEFNERDKTKEKTKEIEVLLKARNRLLKDIKEKKVELNHVKTRETPNYIRLLLEIKHKNLNLRNVRNRVSRSGSLILPPKSPPPNFNKQEWKKIREKRVGE